jgi:hypothetical protein
MNTLKNKRGAEIVNIYTPHLWLKLLMVFISGIMLFIHFPALLWASQDTAEIPSVIFLFLIPLYTGLLWYTVILCTQTRLIVYEDGLELQRGGSRFFSPWENISHFGRHGSGKNSSYGVYLYERVQPEVDGFAEKLFYGWSSDYMALSNLVSIPSRWVSLFEGSKVDTARLVETPFGQDVYRFAPQLFKVSEEKVKRG